MNIKLPLLIITLMGALFISACNAGDSGSHKSMQETAWEAIHNGALLVDVRTPNEYNSGHLEGAKLIPVDQVAARINEFGSDKDRQIVVYCRSGNRSGKAQGILQQHSFTNVINGGAYQSLVDAKH
jgi:phage shock protein E